jgi:hypothetical protein
MKRPDLDTLACANAECQWFRRAGASNLIIRKVYGHDRIRLKLVVSLVVGKRTQEQTDAHTGYESAILEACGRRYPALRRSAQGRAPRTVLRWPQGLTYGQVKKHYQRGRVERVEVHALYGKARLKHVLSLLGYKHINTSVVERHNDTSRLCNQRKVRKTLAFSKAPCSPRWMSWLSVATQLLFAGIAA